MSVRVKREPGSARTRICYVCGESGAIYPLYCRPRERGSYFPFLEQHEIPQGADRPSTPEGIVASCTVCFSFLEQQWESYERSRTPHSKRLYWLKRVDNGHYIGAEMRYQGEYASQVIGVSPEPGGTGGGSGSGHHGQCLATSSHSRTKSQSSSSGRNARGTPIKSTTAGSLVTGSDERFLPNTTDSRSVMYYATEEDSRIASAALLDLSKEGIVSNTRRSSRSSETPIDSRTNESPAPQPPSNRTSSIGNGALDLSMPDKNATTEVCYLCGDECPRGTLVSVYAKPITNCPFFPSLTSHPRPSRSHPMSPSGCVQACGHCHQHLLQQWDNFQKQNVSHADRHYRLRKRSFVSSSPLLHSSSSPTPLSINQPPTRFVCFLCAGEFAFNLRHFLYSGSNPEGEPACPFLERVKVPYGAHPLSATGQAIVCAGCYASVHKQRRETTADYSSSSSRKNSEVRDPNIKESTSVCHSCRLLFSRFHIVYLDFVPTKELGRPFYPFALTDDEKVHGGGGGGVPVCLSCHAVFKAQFEAFEMDRVPHSHRSYVLPSRPSEPNVVDPRPPSRPRRISRIESDTGGTMTTTTNLDVALRIQVPTPDHDAGIPIGGVGTSLLATVSNNSDSPMSNISVGQHNRSGFGPFGNALDLSSGSGRGGIARTVPTHPPPSSPPPLGLPSLSSSSSSNNFGNRTNYLPPSSSSTATVCYMCGLHIKNNKTHSVRSYPMKSTSISSLDNGDQNPSSLIPFFPFITYHPAPLDSIPPSDDGTVIACTFCYHSLMVQWSAYEMSRNAYDRNPWTRTYDCHDYVCYVCGVTTYRKRVKAIRVSDFPFLVEHPRPQGSLVLDGGDAVTVCLMCYDTLHDQWKDFERMKVPVELRKYNWIAAPPPPEDEEPPPPPPPPPPATQVGSNRKKSLNGEGGGSGGGGCGVVARQQLVTIDDDEQKNNESNRQDNRHFDSSPRQHSGLVHNSKLPPPPLLPSGLPSSSGGGGGGVVGSSHKNNIRPSVTMPPLNQVSPGNAAVVTSVSSMDTSRTTSSFAAALRKLAKHAVDPMSEKELSPVSPVASPHSGPSSKRAPPPLVLSDGSHPSLNHGANYSSPNSVNMTSTPHLSYMDPRKGLERPVVSHPRDAMKNLYEDQLKDGHQQHNRQKMESRDEVSRSSSSGSYLGHHRESEMQVKVSASGLIHGHHAEDALKVGSVTSAYYGDRGRDDQLLGVNGLTPSPHFHHHGNNGGSSSRMEDSRSSFQPYRISAEDASRHGLPPHLTSPYDTTSPYAYHPASLLQTHLPQPPFRLDDPLYLERYGLLRAPLFPMPHPGVLPHHQLPFLSGARYPPELLPHPLSLVSPTGHHIMAHERLKMEEEQQRREREIGQYQEQERKWEREKEKERERLNDVNVIREQERALRSQQQQQQQLWSHNHSSESPGNGQSGSIMQGTPREVISRKSTSSSSTAQRNVPTLSPSNSSANVPLLDCNKNASAVGRPWNSHRNDAAVVPTSESMDFQHSELRKLIDTNNRLVLSQHTNEYSNSSRKWSPISEPLENLTELANMDVQRRDLSDGSYFASSRSSPTVKAAQRSRVILSSPSSQYSRGRPSNYVADTGSQWKRSASANNVLEHRSSSNVSSSVRSNNTPAILIDITGESKSEDIDYHSKVNDVPHSNGQSVSIVVTPVANDAKFLDVVPAISKLPTTVMQVNHVGDGCHDAVLSLAAAQSNQLRSKIDLAVEKARNRNTTAKTELSDDEDAVEELRRTHLLTITTGLPLPLDSSRKKLSFLAQFGLITHKRRRELDFDKFLRRKKRLRELSLSPVERLSNDSKTPTKLDLAAIQHHSTKPLSEKANDVGIEPDSPEKRQFLQILGLHRVTRTKRQELDEIQNAVWEEKLRRNGYCFERSIYVPTSDENQPPNSLSCDMTTEAKRPLQQKMEGSLSPFPSSNSVTSTGKVASKLLAPLANSHSRNMSKQRLLLADSKVSKSKTTNSTAAVDISIFSSLKDLQTQGDARPSVVSERNNHPIIGRDFVQEFHESVLMQTAAQQQARVCKQELHTDVFSKQKEELSNDTIAFDGVHKNVRWPGIEALMESYERHQQEQQLEKEVLLEQCHRLKSENQELNNVAENLSKNMADLIQTKMELDAQRQQQHAVIDNLKSFLKQMR